MVPFHISLTKLNLLTLVDLRDLFFLFHHQYFPLVHCIILLFFLKNLLPLLFVHSIAKNYQMLWLLFLLPLGNMLNMKSLLRYSFFLFHDSLHVFLSYPNNFYTIQTFNSFLISIIIHSKISKIIPQSFIIFLSFRSSLINVMHWTTLYRILIRHLNSINPFSYFFDTKRKSVK